MHVKNATIQELKYFAFEAWPKLQSFSITEGKIDHISFDLNSNLSCFNASSNFILDVNEAAFRKMPNLAYLDLSKNNLTKLPNLRNENISLDMSGKFSLVILLF